METNQIKEILAQLADHEKRIALLESREPQIAAPRAVTNGKQKTLREIIKGKKFRNGTEKIAAIVGYNEMVLGTLIKKDDISHVWKEVKFEGTYKTNLLDDAMGIYVREQSSGECDLTQGGEEFFTALLNNESTGATSK